ncbi:MAG TPA: HAD family hydrolase [Sandaracinaceae bacterium]
MRAVLFDLDGTLIDSGALYMECYRRAFEAELDELPSWEEMMQRRPASERYFLLDWLGPELGHRVHERVCEAYDALAGELLGGFYEGVPEMLAELRARGVPMGLVTGKSRRAFAATCRCLELERWFNVVVLEDDVPAPKPDPSGLKKALAAMGAAPGEAVYVGDTPMDVEAAQRAGMIGASALWSRGPTDRARVAKKLPPDVWALHAPSELVTRIR